MESIPPKPAIVDFFKVSKIYSPDVVALREVVFTVRAGETLFLTGRSGAGKSTIVKLICALERPTKGVVEVAGQDLAKVSAPQRQAIRQQMGVAYQDFKLLPGYSVAHNVAMPMEVAYTPKKVIRDRISYLLDTLDLTSKRDVRVDKLSRGEQQRVAIARAAANYPPLILADEPTGNLDSATTKLVLKLFEQLRRAGTTLIIATHDRALFLNSPHPVLELAQGKIVSYQPAHPSNIPAAGA